MPWITTTSVEEEHICRYDLNFTVVELKVKRNGDNWHCHAFGKELICPVTEATLDRAKSNCIRMAKGIAQRFLAAVEREEARERDRETLRSIFRGIF